MAYDYDNLQRLLEAERYPARYVHKFIGKHTPAFQASVEKLETEFPRATRVGRRESVGRHGGPPQYVSYTFELFAESAEEIVRFIQFTAGLVDVKVIL